MQDKEVLLARAEDLSDEEGMQLGELEMVIAEEDGYMAEAEANELLKVLALKQTSIQTNCRC